MMNATSVVVAGYIAWFIVLLVSIIVLRITHTAKTGKPANSYQSDGSDVSPFSERLCAAHINCVESTPFVLGLPLLALATGNADITNGAAVYVLAARIAQSSVHLYATSENAVKVRATFFTIQVVIAIYWAVSLVARS